jgi:protein SCO1/2
MFSKKFLFSQILFVLAAVLLLIVYFRPKTVELNILGQVKDFQLTNSEGKTVTLNDLKGKVWVADFFFTTCSGICPMMNTHMSHLYEIFKPYSEVRLVSFSVNPENDNPEVLKTYAKKFHADTQKWIFLTGSREALTKVAVESFKMGDIHEPIFHSSYFTLVDKQGRIRGYYDSTDPKNITKVISDLTQLLKSGE